MALSLDACLYNIGVNDAAVWRLKPLFGLDLIGPDNAILTLKLDTRPHALVSTFTGF